MKILLIIDQLDCGGAEQQLVTLCRGLKMRGHDVHVVSIYDRTALRGDLEQLDIPVTVAHKFHRFDLGTVLRLRRIIAEVDPDLVHAYLPAASLLTPMTKWLGVTAPVLLSERGVNDWRSATRLLCDNVARRNVARITCNAAAIRDYLVDVERVPAEKVTVIYNGLRDERRRPPDDSAVAAATRQIGAPPQAVLAICVANFSAVKQHGTLLKAFAQARQRAGNLFLVLVGRGELEGQVRSHIGELGLSAACRVITDCVNPAALLRASQIAVLASLHEGCSNALLEAMAMGLPVVASNAGGNRELIVDGAGGHLCPVGDTAAFADALVSLAEHRDTAASMGDYNRDRVDQMFTDDVMVEQNLSLYEGIVTGA